MFLRTMSTTLINMLCNIDSLYNKTGFNYLMCSTVKKKSYYVHLLSTASLSHARCHCQQRKELFAVNRFLSFLSTLNNNDHRSRSKPEEILNCPSILWPDSVLPPGKTRPERTRPCPRPTRSASGKRVPIRPTRARADAPVDLRVDVRRIWPTSPSSRSFRKRRFSKSGSTRWRVRSKPWKWLGLSRRKSFTRKRRRSKTLRSVGDFRWKSFRPELSGIISTMTDSEVCRTRPRSCQFQHLVGF